jgi:hypothetical protein
MLERSPRRPLPGRSNTPAAIRARKSRARRKVGMRTFQVEGDEHRLAAALIASGRLTEEQALSRALVEGELAKLLADWASRWVGK